MSDSQAPASAPVPRRRLRWLVRLLVVCVLILIASPFVLYFGWQAYGRARLRHELDQIVAAGEPLTTAEMAASYALPPGAHDTTPLWSAALEPFAGDVMAAITKDVLGEVNYQDKAPRLDQQLPPWQQEAIDEYLQTHAGKHAALYAAATAGGEVRYPRDFEEGINLQVGELAAMPTAMRSLRIELHQLVRAQDYQGALNNLQLRIALAETLANDPPVVSYMLRINLALSVFADIHELLEMRKLTDAQLQAIQQWIRPLDVYPHMYRVGICERAMHYWGFASMAKFSPEGVPPATMATTYDISKVMRPDDCAEYLRLQALYLAAVRQPLTDNGTALSHARREADALTSTTSRITNKRYLVTKRFIAFNETWIFMLARFQTRRDLVDVALAAERYRLSYGQFPGELSALVPTFLPAVPLDLASDGPLLSRVIDDNFVIYSLSSGLDETPPITDPRREPYLLRLPILPRSSQEVP